MIKRMRRINCVHFVGIGGSGMSGIAEVMLSLGYDVQGSDLKRNKSVKRLESQGARVFIGHSADNISKHMGRCNSHMGCESETRHKLHHKVPACIEL